MDDHVLSRAQADQLGYTLTIGDCAERLTIGLKTVRGLVDLPADDPRHLPAVRIPARRGHAHRVRPQDLDELVARTSAPASLPDDAVSQIQALAILANEAVRSQPKNHVHVLWRGRLNTAVRDGRVTEYEILGMHRYSTAELRLEKTRLDAEGVNGRGSRRKMRTVRIRAAESEGHVTARKAARMAHVRYETVRDRWGPQGRYGARKLGGEWFFECAQVEARPDRAKQSHSRDALERPCAGGCGRTLRRTPSRFRRNKSGAYYCIDCWRRVAPEVLREALANMEPAELYRRRSEAQRRAWVVGGESRKLALADIVRAAGGGERLREHHRKPTSTEKRIDSMMQTRFGHGLTDQRRSQIKGNALGRAQRQSERSQAARMMESRLRELWPTSKTVPQIAEELQTTVSNVKKLRQRLNLPVRPRGRRNSDKTLGVALTGS